jgi:hypothetical protein
MPSVGIAPGLFLTAAPIRLLDGSHYDCIGSAPAPCSWGQDKADRRRIPDTMP